MCGYNGKVNRKKKTQICMSEGQHSKMPPMRAFFIYSLMLVSLFLLLILTTAGSLILAFLASLSTKSAQKRQQFLGYEDFS